MNEKLNAVKRYAELLGQRAFKCGSQRFLEDDLEARSLFNSCHEFRVEAMKSWYDGWDKANIAAPLPPMLDQAADAAKADRVNEPAWARGHSSVVPCASVHCRHYDLAGGVKCEEQVRREQAYPSDNHCGTCGWENGRAWHYDYRLQRRVWSPSKHVCNCKGVQRERHIKRGSCDI